MPLEMMRSADPNRMQSSPIKAPMERTGDLSISSVATMRSFCSRKGSFWPPKIFETRSGPAIHLPPHCATRDYHLAKLADSKEANTQPYPLLLVRPGGILAYYHAREAIASWGPDFGYELIDGDWELELPSADPQLAHLLYRAVETARARQRALARAAPRRFQESGSGGTSTDNLTGGGGGRFTVDVDQLPGGESELFADEQGQGGGRPGPSSHDRGYGGAGGDRFGSAGGSEVNGDPSPGGMTGSGGTGGRETGAVGWRVGAVRGRRSTGGRRRRERNRRRSS